MNNQRNFCDMEVPSASEQQFLVNELYSSLNSKCKGMTPIEVFAFAESNIPSLSEFIIPFYRSSLNGVPFLADVEKLYIESEDYEEYFACLVIGISSYVAYRSKH